MQKRREFPFLSLRKIAAEVAKETGTAVSHSSVKRVLNKNGLYAYSPACKPLLKPEHIAARKKIAEGWLKLGIDDVKTIIFSDESNFNLFTSDGKQSVWREPGKRLDQEYVVPTVKHGGGHVMVWACFSYNGVGELHFIEGNMDQYDYTHILSSHLKPSCRKMGLKEYIFQHDNDPKHRSTHTRHYLAMHNIKILSWPSQSPDLNPIENLWAIVKAEVAKLAPKTIPELKAAILKAWNSIPVKTCQDLALSFMKRRKDVLKAKGGYIDY